MTQCLISVLLPVYNGGDYVNDAIFSILNQTHENFELIIINDGSTDNSGAIIQNIKDNRIRYYEQANHGLAATLNRAILLSKGKYLARQDQDDLAHSQRFEKQISFLESHPRHGMVGTWAKILWEVKSNHKKVITHPTESLLLKYALLMGTPFVHSSMMIRRDVFDNVGLYSTDKSRQPPEDYELWSRIARAYEIANIPEYLQIYRATPNSMSRASVNTFIEQDYLIMTENLSYALGSETPNSIITDIAALRCKAYHKLSADPSLSAMKSILYKLADHLGMINGAPRDILRTVVNPYYHALQCSYVHFRYGKLLSDLLSYWYRIIRNIQ